MKIVGRDGVVLHDVWQDDPRAYLGITMPGFPNLFCLYGPGTNLAQHSRKIPPQRVAYEQAWHRDTGIDGQRVQQNHRRVGSWDQRPGALEHVDWPADVTHLDSHGRKILEPENMLEAREKHGRVDSLLEDVAVAFRDPGDVHLGAGSHQDALL